MNILSITFRAIIVAVWIIVDMTIVLFNSAVWVRLSPPASALLTLPKMIYPNIANKAIYGYFGLAFVMTAVLVLAQLKVLHVHRNIKILMAITLVILSIVTISSDIYINKLKYAKIEYATSLSDNNPATKTAYKVEHRKVVDLRDRFMSNKAIPEVFKLYLPDQTVIKRDVIIYLAYGNWNAVNENIADYFVDALNENGYAAIVFTGQTRKDTDFTGMIKDIKEKVAFLRENSDEFGVGRIFLSGGSAGANLALTASYSSSIQDFQVAGLTEEQTSIDGVIAFYPVVDMVYNYYFYTSKSEENMGLFDRMGDVLFSMTDANKAKSICESHKMVMSALLGGFPDDASMKHIYTISSPICLVNENAPPTLLIHGTHDSMTPIEPTREMFAKLKSSGVNAAMLELPFTDHAFDVISPKDSVVTKKVLQSVFEWLSRIQITNHPDHEHQCQSDLRDHDDLQIEEAAHDA